MQRYLLELSYNGKNYHGWQIQPNAMTVQQKLEESISLLLNMKTEIVGAGRTDAGVHASYYVAHFDTECDILKLINLVSKLNNFLPKDIAIKNLYKVSNDFHARFSALSRTYKYYTTTSKDPFNFQTTLKVRASVDYEAMNIAAKELLIVEDFTTFSKLHTDTKTNICKVFFAQWEQSVQNPLHYIFTIKADRFLRNMVRAIVGTLLEIGYKKKSIDDFRTIINSKNRAKAGVSVPGNALFLTDISYPDFGDKII